MTEAVVYFRTTSRSDFVFYADRLVSQGFFFVCSQGPYFGPCPNGNQVTFSQF